MQVLALIPARKNSRGIPNKNFTPLAGESFYQHSPLMRAVHVAEAAIHPGRVVVTSDAEPFGIWLEDWIQRPPELAQDDTPMIDVVKHALAEIPGPDDEIVLLLQPTQPLRQPKHLTAAIALLQSSGADSVVSVVEVPKAQSPQLLLDVDAEGRAVPWLQWYQDVHVGEGFGEPWSDMPTRRQDAHPAYLRDGTVYAFWRRTLKWGHLYGAGNHVRAFIIPPEETCPLDTPEDWADAERRLRAL